ncbi:hypothetical protein BDD43_2949 [Mucilaginibacter gracilis]|uniref:Uncharacterized protein n=1 Tax=Mucilaginibacter gracilis TaxID=423350 RepID=A0A495J1T0_9SPHI|nr:hypothetical protein [Mucilaginibacter gracilis]RKR82763.1 hypothetical protein BDD43_2949 [Mucilaginibacter gracilis]
MSKILKALLCVVILITSANIAYADKIAIKQFVVKDNPFGKNEIAVVAVDTAGVIQEAVSGDFLFSINGFQELLKFENGTAFYHHKLTKSSFIYLKHENDTGTHSTLFYVYKSDSKMIPIHISWMVLFGIPVILAVLAYVFKRFIIIAVALFAIFIYFNHSGGLGISTFFETVVDGIKHIFSPLSS